jgi:Tfp pilus assembly protein PilV
MMRMNTYPARRPGQRGVTLVEALVALMVMAFGMVALVGLLGNLRRSTDLAKQRSEAMRIAQSELARLRAFSVLRKDAGGAATVHDYDTDIVTPQDASLVTPANSNTTYTVTRTVTDLMGSEPPAKSVRVTVVWTDRAGKTGDATQPGAPQQVTLDTVLSRNDPVFGGAASITPPPGEVRQPSNRHPAIPISAKDLGNKSSAYRPGATSSTVWVFSNVTGVITGKCSIPAGTPVSSLTAADVESCKNNTVGYLASGTIRFSATSPANPGSPEANAIPLSVYVNLTSTGHSVTPPYECFANAPTSVPSTQPFVNYDCIIYPNSDSPRIWSGQILLSDLSLGPASTQYKVCRYSADYNGDGKVNNNEHPAAYASVSGSLARQNFLVVRGDVACPTAPAVNPTSDIFIDYTTYQLQPQS